MSSPLFFLCVLLYVKEKDHVKRNRNSEERNVYVGNQYYYFGLPKIRVSWALTGKK